ncbi:MAG TPA: ketopantoate reductase C-terminal domain-containing protein [Methylomirabilota bacterium]|nr:ketopantoate reductase C-terminal domain-containing protein [Methylomirabilota bacterium]
MTTRLLFIGAGAIGAYLGAFLARAGQDVTLIDPWAEQIDAIRRAGIAVTGPHEPFTQPVTALHLHEAQRLGADFEVAFVAVKSYDTAWATHLALRHLAPSGYVVSAQNCWNDPLIASIAGRERSVGLIMSKIAVACWEPGQVGRGAEKSAGTGHDVFRPGEHDGRITPRVEELARMLSVIDGARPTDNLWGERWSKLCANCMGNPVQAMTGLGTLEIAADPRGREITIRLAEESARVGLALALRVPKFSGAPAEQWAEAGRPAVYKELDAMLVPREGAGRNWRASMAQDVIKGRRTEIAFMNGHVVSKGKEVEIPTPVSAAVVGLVEEIGAGARKPAPETIELALRRAGF